MRFVADGFLVQSCQLSCQLAAGYYIRLAPTESLKSSVAVNVNWGLALILLQLQVHLASIVTA